jgi:hypothetical protein
MGPTISKPLRFRRTSELLKQIFMCQTPFLTQPQFSAVGLAFGVNTHSQGSWGKQLLIRCLITYLATGLHIWWTFHSMPPVHNNITNTASFKVSHPFPPHYQATHAYIMLTTELHLVTVHDLHASRWDNYINTTIVMANSHYKILSMSKCLKNHIMSYISSCDKKC